MRWSEIVIVRKGSRYELHFRNLFGTVATIGGSRMNKQAAIKCAEDNWQLNYPHRTPNITWQK